jgi:hypothetical protein
MTAPGMRVGGAAAGVRVSVPARFRLQAPVASEHQQQRQVTDVMRLEICREGHLSPHGVCWFSIDMAHFAGVPGTRIARGICAGVPDMVLIWKGRVYWIEIKTDRGVLSDDQRAMCAALVLSGSHYAVVRDADELLACIDEWQIPRNRRVRVAA